MGKLCFFLNIVYWAHCRMIYWTKNLISISSLRAATVWYWKRIFLCLSAFSETCKEMPFQSMNNYGTFEHTILIPLIINSVKTLDHQSNQYQAGDVIDLLLSTNLKTLSSLAEKIMTRTMKLAFTFHSHFIWPADKDMWKQLVIISCHCEFVTIM